MTTEIVKTGAPEPLTIAAAEFHAGALINQFSGWANALMRVVEAKELFTIINGKKYLEFEAWQLIGTFDHARLSTDDVVEVLDNGDAIGYMCNAKVLKDGVVIGAASQMCGYDSFPCRGREGTDKRRAAISAAQTWAGSKALRMLYSSVAVLGGYGAATAEEMRVTAEPDHTAHWCETHQTNWFKRGRMRNYAHPIEGTSEWCNEPTPAKARESQPNDNLTPGPGDQMPQDDATLDAEPLPAPEPSPTPTAPCQGDLCRIAEHGGKGLLLVTGDPRPKHPVYVRVGGKEVLDRWCYGE